MHLALRGVHLTIRNNKSYDKENKMKITLFGASGMIGSRILAELVARGHAVTAVTRHPENITRAEAKAEAGDLLHAHDVVRVATGADAVVSAYAPGFDAPARLLDAARTLTGILPTVNVSRLLWVSGAGSLEVAPGVQLADAPDFPAAWKPTALAHRDALQILAASKLQWTALSPAALISPGHRTGKFRLGLDQLITDEKGQSSISAEDYAVAVVDELETPRHIRQRFTLGY